MDYILRDDKRVLFLPAIFSFLVALLLLFKFSFPISWDVYFHVHMINVYLEKGLVFWDYLTVAPQGRLIMYPPLFHLMFAGICKLFNISAMELCRLVQPLFSAYLIGIITFVTYKLSNVKTAFLTGFLVMFCFITFNRSVICTPATIAIGLFLLSITYCFKGIEEDNMKEIIISALALAVIWNLHMATAILTSGVIGLYFIIQFLHKRWNFRFIIVYILIVLCVGLPWWIYIALNYTLLFNSLAGADKLMSDFFFRYYGLIPSLLLIIGYYVLYRKKSACSIFLFVSSISLVLLSQVNYLGFNTVSIRILEVASYVLIIVSGIGLGYIYEKKLSSVKAKNMFVLIVVLLSVFSSFLYVDSYTPDVLSDDDYNGTIVDENIHLVVNPVVSKFKPTVISTRFADSNLAHDRYEVLKYFVDENSTLMLVSEDAVMDTIVVSTSRTPVVYGGFTESIPLYVTDPVHIIKGWSSTDELHKLSIGYLLLKKDTPIPYYAELCYENSNYKICKISEKYR